jgi:magnesium-dependent phosphatase-1
MKLKYDIKNSIFNDYETVLFDLDNTVWNCYNQKGSSIDSCELNYPFHLIDENTVKDVDGNICVLQKNIKDVLENLDDWGINLGIVSRSAKENVPDEAQPAIMLLKKFDIYKFFNYIVVIKSEIDKADYAKPYGKTLFIDDDKEQLESVNKRGLVDTLDRKSFKDWNNLFSYEEVKDYKTTLEYVRNTPQPIASLKLSLVKKSVPESYTDSSDIDEGIGGGAKDKANMFYMHDHFNIDNNRDHIWLEHFEPMKQYFLDETHPSTIEDKIKNKYPDKGGIATSALELENYDDNYIKHIIDYTLDYYMFLIIGDDYFKNVDTFNFIKKEIIKSFHIPEEIINKYEQYIKDSIYYFVNKYKNLYESEKLKLKNDIKDFLSKKLRNETFHIEDVIKFIHKYINSSTKFTNIAIKNILYDIIENNPHEFKLNGDLLTIGEKLESNIHLNYDELKQIALSPIEYFKKFGKVYKTPYGIYIYIDNNSDILGIAHLDTVQDYNHFYVKNHSDGSRKIINSQLDDRLGAYILLKVLPRLGINADILLTEGEEQGRSTAKYFKPNKQYKWIFSFDRNGIDTVMYQYHDNDTHELLDNHNFIVGRGSFSDIAFLEHLGVKGFNFGVGYYDNHSKNSYAVESHILHNIKLFKDFYEKYKNVKLPHLKVMSSLNSLKFKVFSNNPKAEQYDDYMNNMDVSPLDPKTREDKEKDDSIRKDLEKMYYGRGLHNNVNRQETYRPLTPYAHKFSNILSRIPKTKSESIEQLLFALYSAKNVLFLYERKFPNDNKLRDLLNKVIEWLSDKNKNIKKLYNSINNINKSVKLEENTPEFFAYKSAYHAISLAYTNSSFDFTNAIINARKAANVARIPFDADAILAKAEEDAIFYSNKKIRYEQKEDSKGLINAPAVLDVDEDEIIDAFVSGNVPTDLWNTREFINAPCYIVGEDNGMYKVKFSDKELQQFAEEYGLDLWYKDQIRILNNNIIIQGSMSSLNFMNLHEPNSLLTHESVRDAVKIFKVKERNQFIRYETQDDTI